MKFNIDSQIWNDVLSILRPAIDNNAVLPALRCVQITGQDNQLILIGAKNTFSLQYTIPNIEVINPRSVLVENEVLYNLSRSLNGTLEVTINHDKLTIVSGNSEYSIGLISADNFPIIDFSVLNDLDGEFLNFPDFIDKISKLIHCLPTYDEFSPLYGICVSKGFMVTTDRQRGATVNLDTDLEFILPGDIAKTISKYDMFGQLQLIVSDDGIYGQVDNIRFKASKITQPYPINEVGEIINKKPQEQYISFQFNAPDIENALNRLLIVADIKTKAVNIKVKDQKMILSTKVISRKGTETIDVKHEDLPKFELNVDGSVLLEAVKIIPGIANWLTAGSKSVQYLEGNDVLQFFMGLRS